MTKKGHGLLLIIFAQTCLIWNNSKISSKNWLMGHFSHSIFVTDPKFSISIEKRWQTWIFSEFHKSILKCLFFQLFWLKLNHFHCNLSSFNGYSAHLVFSVALKSFKMLEIWRKSGMIVADLPNYLVSLA